MSKPTQYEKALAFQMYAPNPDWSKVPKARKQCTEKKQRPEEELQISCVKLLRRMPRTLCFSIPNHIGYGGKNSGARIGYMAKQKAMGLLAGAADLMIIFKNRHGHTTVCCAELKAGGNLLSENQKAFFDISQDVGCFTSVVRSLEDLIGMLRKAEHPYYH